MTTYRSPIVGMHFRPPASAVLALLPGGCPLRLEPEPENQYDQDAIRVRVSPEAVLSLGSKAQLEETLPNFGWTLSQLFAARWLQLGYCANEKNLKAHSYGTIGCRGLGEALRASWKDESGQRFLLGKLVFDAAGRPMVEVEVV